MKLKYKLITLGLGMLIGIQAHAEPWCYGGTIVTVANVDWNGTTNEVMSGGTSWPWSVSDAGSVSKVYTGPYTLTNSLEGYELSMGVSFSCEKCYSMPIYQRVKELRQVRPLPGTEGTLLYQREVKRQRNITN